MDVTVFLCVCVWGGGGGRVIKKINSDAWKIDFGTRVGEVKERGRERERGGGGVRGIEYGGWLEQQQTVKKKKKKSKK